MVVKKIAKNPNKKTYKNMTYANMETYIMAQANAKELMDEFYRQRKLASISKNPYKYVLNWFIEKFQDSDEYFTNMVTVTETQNSQLYA